MKKFEGFLLVSDIDGTLAEQRYINPANITAINRFVADGGQVLLATGRSPQSSVPVAKKLGCSAKLIANNGAVVYDTALGKVVSQKSLDCKQISLDIVEKFTVGGIFYCGEELWLFKNNPEISSLIESEQLTVKDSCDGVINKVLFGGTSTVIDELDAYLRSIPDLVGDVVRSDKVFVEILPNGVNKGSVMMDVAAQLGISSDKIFVAGNYYNDIGMLKKGAVTCVPSDSPDDLKAMVDYVACPCREGAVAEFIDCLYQRY